MPKLLAYLPCEKVVVESETPVAAIDFEKGVRQQVINRLASFPIWTPGTCHLNLMVKIARDPGFRPLASVLIMLRHSRS